MIWISKQLKYVFQHDDQCLPRQTIVEQGGKTRMWTVEFSRNSSQHISQSDPTEHVLCCMVLSSRETELKLEVSNIYFSK
jgi:hypothetical protein